MYIEISRYIEFKSIFVYMYNVIFWKKRRLVKQEFDGILY